ncbi:MAG: hypothetical protein LAQ69_22450 [Acidobacteriia bacterium]|nr:hypothetical protein [Terriglobia bacterium]
MPFTPPATYASKSTTGYLGTFEIGDAASPPNWALVSELKSFKGNYFSTPAVNVSHLCSPNATEEERPGLMKPGTVDFSGNFIGDTAQLNLLQYAQNNADQNPPTYPFRAKMPVQNGTKTYTCTGIGFVSKYEVGPTELNKPIEFAGALQITGIVSEAVA